MKTTLFSGAALKAIVDKTLLQVPPDKTLAVVTTVDDKGVSVAVAVKDKSGRWTIGAAVTKDNVGGLQAGASVQLVL